MYDGYQWSIFHTPGTTRVTAVHRAKDGHIWFGGPGVLGYFNRHDSTTFLTDENNGRLHFNEVKRFDEPGGKLRFTTVDGKVYAVNGNRITPLGQTTEEEKPQLIEGDRIQDQLTIPGGNTFYATSSKGLIIRSKDGSRTYRITTADQLPSNSINALAYDGRGTVWAATDNGIFKMTTSTCYTYYSKPEGISSMINCLYQTGDVLLIGTQEGLLTLRGGIISQVPGIHHTCWQMAGWTGHGVLIASADGVFVYNAGALSRISEKHTLSLFVESTGSFLAGELDGIYRYTPQHTAQPVDRITNVTRFQQESDGTLWLINLDNETYRLQPGAAHFAKAANKSLTNLFSYTDDKHNTWTSLPDGKGLTCNQDDKRIERYARPLQSYTFSSMLLCNGVAWLGGTSSLVRWDLYECAGTHPVQPHLYYRCYEMDGKRLFCAVSNDVSTFESSVQYSYRLHSDDEWSRWTPKQELEIPDLSPGSYQLQVRSRDAFGQVAYAEERTFSVPQPWYMSWYASILYLFVIIFLVWNFFHWRLKRMHSDKMRLESMVDERTRELRDTQSQLLRKEKEATVGKLTSGLIDRILNPMNYINNFSHLTRGLIKDLRQDVEDEQQHMSQDNYDDCLDVLDMMNQNLEKIEQHGLSTTRILKAMEEMLRDRSGRVEELDLCGLCAGDIEKLGTYYASDIEQLHIQVQWQKPDVPVTACVNADLMSRTLMSMLTNSMYYLSRKVEKGNLPADYTPCVRLTLTPRQAGRPVQIGIWDNGLGIEAGILDKVFDPFFTTKPTSEAPGVGLYLSQQIIQDLGGNITVSSRQGEYTEFIITLP